MGQPNVNASTDELINALVDEQPPPQEQTRANIETVFDEAFNRRVGELHKIRDLIRLAYRDLPMLGRGRATVSAKAAEYQSQSRKAQGEQN